MTSRVAYNSGMLAFYQSLTELTRSGVPHVVVTLVAVRGEAPNDPGCKMIVTAEGLHFGTVGGGKVENRAIGYAREWLASGADRAESPTRLMTWNLQKDIGMTCGGEVDYLFERCEPRRWEVTIFGAGHVSQALVRVLLPLKVSLTVVDSRSEWLERLPSAAHLTKKLAAEPAAEVAAAREGTYFVVMTQGHATDVPILTALSRLAHPLPYVGAIGSRIKAGRIKTDLRERGVDESFCERLRCPVGLPIGDNSPEEIALSIAAELLQVRGA